MQAVGGNNLSASTRLVRAAARRPARGWCTQFSQEIPLFLSSGLQDSSLEFHLEYFEFLMASFELTSVRLETSGNADYLVKMCQFGLCIAPQVYEKILFLSQVLAM